MSASGEPDQQPTDTEAFPDPAGPELSTQQIRSLLESVTHSLCALDQQWRYRYLNDKAVQLSGKTRRDLLGRKIWEVFPQLLDTEFEHKCRLAMEQQRSVVFESYHPRQAIWFEIRATPTAEGLSIYAQDITDRKRAKTYRFLVESSQILTSSLDYRKTLATLTGLAVPALADWCVADMLEPDGSLRRLAVAHRDPAKLDLSWEVERRYPINPDDAYGPPNVMRTGQAELVPEIPDALLPTLARDEQHLEILRSLGLKSYMIVPLKARGRMLGTITFIAAESGRCYGPDDLALAEDLAGRASQAVDNARLYQEAQVAIAIQENLRARLEAIFETMVDGVIVFDTQSQIVKLNSAFSTLFAFDRRPGFTELPIAEWLEIVKQRDEKNRPIPPEKWVQHRILRGEVLTGSRSVDLRFRALDGRELQVNATGGPVRDAAGAITGAVLIVRDVTERRGLEQRTQEVLNALLAMAEALVLFHEHETGQAGLEGTERGVARRLAELTRSALECERVAIYASVPGTNLLKPMVVVGIPLEQERQVLASPPIPYQDEELLKRLKANEVLVLDANEAALRGRLNSYHLGTFLVAPMLVGNYLTGILALDHPDKAHVYSPEEIGLARAIARLSALVLERERLLRERAEAQSQALVLQEANRRMDEFMGIASHELKTPLTSIKGSIQFAERRLSILATHPELQQGDISARVEQLGRMLVSASQQIRRLERLINDLLDVSRIQAGQLVLRLEPVDLTKIISEAVGEQRHTLPGREITLTLPELPVVLVLADADRIGQVVTNLLSNALKYSRDYHPVAIGLDIERGQARAWVQDHGPGLAPEETDHIWERFYRAPGVKLQSGSGVGLGLGLFITRTIIERHHGSVGVRSVPGEGATFFFTLPLLL